MKEKKEIALKELNRLYKEAGIKHDEIDLMKQRWIEELDNCPLIRKKIDFLERLLGVTKSQYDCLVEIINKQIKILHKEIDLNLKIKSRIMEEWAGLVEKKLLEDKS